MCASAEAQKQVLGLVEGVCAKISQIIISHMRERRGAETGARVENIGLMVPNKSRPQSMVQGSGRRS